MAKRWSQLQRDLYQLMDRSDNFQIHCVGYRMPESRSNNPQIPRYWITVGTGEAQKIIWDWPGNFLDVMEQRCGKAVPMKYFHYYHVPAISNLIREYINTPRNELKSKKFETDIYGLTDIFKSFDRRFK